MARAKITLRKSLTAHKGRYKFVQHQTQVTDDAKLIEACRLDGQFAVTMVDAGPKKPGRRSAPTRVRETGDSQPAAASAPADGGEGAPADGSDGTADLDSDLDL